MASAPFPDVSLPERRLLQRLPERLRELVPVEGAVAVHVAHGKNGVNLVRRKRHVPIRERLAYLLLIEAPIAVLLEVGVGWGRGSGQDQGETGSD